MLIWKVIKGTSFSILALLFYLLIEAYNIEIFTFFNNAPMLLRKVFLVLTLFGDGAFALILFFLLMFAPWTYRFRALPLMSIGILSYLGSGILVQIIKRFSEAARPAKVLSAESLNLLGPQLHNYAFPSGHAATALAWTTLFFILSKDHKVKGFWLTFGVLIALSRVVIGAHWPDDIFVGAIIGYSTTHILYQKRASLETYFDRLISNRPKVYLRIRLINFILLLTVLLYSQFGHRYIRTVLGNYFLIFFIPLTLFAVYQIYQTVILMRTRKRIYS